MPRTADNARKRLMEAALELFAENGFEQTTAAQIAERAGVTERTFFRHFPDKREVLFDGQAILGAALSNAIAAAPPDLPPIAVLRQAFNSVVELFEQNRSFSEPRQRVIAASPALQEREVAKSMALMRLLADALRRRGVEGQRATLVAHAGLAVLGYALTGWFADAAVPLREYLDRAFDELHHLAGPDMSRGSDGEG